MLAQGEIDHGGDGETPFGGQTHGGTPSAGGGATNELNDGWPHAEPNRLKTRETPRAIASKGFTRLFQSIMHEAD
jgi:hypothetical protein